MNRMTSNTIKKSSQNINKISVTRLKRPNTGQDDDDDDTEVMEITSFTSTPSSQCTSPCAAQVV
jgi:hypothetical protein